MDHEDLVEQNRELAIQVGVLNRQQELPREALAGPGQQAEPNDRLHRFFACIIRAMTTAAAAVVVAWSLNRAGLRWEEIDNPQLIQVQTALRETQLKLVKDFKRSWVAMSPSSRVHSKIKKSQ
ncbi:hypothetical protein F5Y12DRAFT_712354 [Xylaria sp. FL1777]|nr:hypothetical protein F5Y12DRAFT_712354 [Xylaria sp. FL1777]